MKEHDFDNHPLDELLREHLSGDPPCEVEASMREQLRYFQKKWEERDQSAKANTPRYHSAWRKRIAIVWRRTAILSASAAAFAFCFLLLSNCSRGAIPSPLASAISGLQAVAATLTELRKADAMKAEICFREKEKAPACYDAEWRKGSSSRVERRSQEGNLEESWSVQNGTIEISSPSGMISAPIEEWKNKADPMAKYLLQFLSAMDVENQLKGVWTRKESQKQNGVEWIHYSIAKNGVKDSAELWIDAASKLPKRMKTVLQTNQNPIAIDVDIQFTWYRSIP
ncbi:MAG: hypothetical protein AB1656_14030 [Candidatus Omnitrophota bacterium]